METLLFHDCPYNVVAPDDLTGFTQDEATIREKFWNTAIGDIVFDVGAGFGLYTLPALATGATVNAFEPEPTAYGLLLQNVKANPTFEDRFILHPYALGAKEEHIDFYEMNKRHGYIIKDESSSHFGIDIRTIDSLGMNKLNLIKIDVEGGELEVLQGGKETLTKYKPSLLIENYTKVDNIGSWMTKTNMWSNLMTLLQTYGYTQFAYITWIRDFLFVE